MYNDGEEGRKRSCSRVRGRVVRAAQLSGSGKGLEAVPEAQLTFFPSSVNRQNPAFFDARMGRVFSRPKIASVLVG